MKAGEWHYVKVRHCSNKRHRQAAPCILNQADAVASVAAPVSCGDESNFLPSLARWSTYIERGLSKIFPLYSVNLKGRRWQEETNTLDP